MTEIPKHYFRAELEAQGASEVEPTEQSATTQSLGQLIADSLLIEAGVPECSIAASDTAKDAAELFAQRRFLNPNTSQATLEELGSDDNALVMTRKHERQLRMADEEFKPETMLVRPLEGRFMTETGREIQLALAKPVTKRRSKQTDGAPANHLMLLAVTRDQLAFELVTFRRSNKQYCDHLQFWGESRMSELESENFYGWGTDDNGSRFDAVQAVANVFTKQEASSSAALAKILKLEERIDGQLGSTNPETEAIIDQLLHLHLRDKQLVLEHEFPEIQMGRNKTELTVSAVVEAVEGWPDRRLVKVNRHPSSQPDSQDWPERLFTVDLYEGISALTKQGEKSVPTELDIKIIRDLVETSGHIERAAQPRTAYETIFNRKVYAAQAITALLVDTYLVKNGIGHATGESYGLVAVLMASYMTAGTYLKHREQVKQLSSTPELLSGGEEEEAW